MSVQKIDRRHNTSATLSGLLPPLAIGFPIYGGIILYLHMLVLYALTALKARLR